MAETEQYYFHPDHLGSSNYITNIAGEVSQHMEYFAFGETFVEEHKNSHNSPYKFNGKELDEESGLYYYGVRYYDPKISIWASVDPMAEYYPDWSPYAYCMNNPINMIDPTGMEGEKVIDPPSSKKNPIVLEDVVIPGRKKSSNEGKATDFTPITGGAKDIYRSCQNDNFWQGSVTGLVVSAQNHAMHSTFDNDSVGNGEADQGDPKPKGKSSYTPKPKKLPDGAEKLRPKGGRPRYRLPDGDIIEWDGQHGEWERYNPRGKHTGVLNPDGELIKNPVPGRTITPYTAPHTLPQFQMPNINWTAVGVGVGVGIIIIATDGLVTPFLAL